MKTYLSSSVSIFMDSFDTRIKQSEFAWPSTAILYMFDNHLLLLLCPFPTPSSGRTLFCHLDSHILFRKSSQLRFWERGVCFTQGPSLPIAPFLPSFIFFVAPLPLHSTSHIHRTPPLLSFYYITTVRQKDLPIHKKSGRNQATSRKQEREK